MLVLWMINTFVIWRAVSVSWVSPFKWKTGFLLWWTYEGSWQVLVGTRPAEQKKSKTKHKLDAPPHSSSTTFFTFPSLSLSLSPWCLCMKVFCVWLYVELCMFVASDVDINNSFSLTNMMWSRWAGNLFIKHFNDAFLQSAMCLIYVARHYLRGENGYKSLMPGEPDLSSLPSHPPTTFSTLWPPARTDVCLKR